MFSIILLNIQYLTCNMWCSGCLEFWNSACFFEELICPCRTQIVTSALSEHYSGQPSSLNQAEKREILWIPAPHLAPQQGPSEEVPLHFVPLKKGPPFLPCPTDVFGSWRQSWDRKRGSALWGQRQASGSSPGKRLSIVCLSSSEHYWTRPYFYPFSLGIPGSYFWRACMEILFSAFSVTQSGIHLCVVERLWRHWGMEAEDWVRWSQWTNPDVCSFPRSNKGSQASTQAQAHREACSYQRGFLSVQLPLFSS